MKFLQDLGSKIVSKDPSTLGIVESVFGFVIYVSLGFVLGVFVQPWWLAISLAIIFPTLMIIKINIARLVAEQKAIAQTTQLFTSTMMAIFAPRKDGQAAVYSDSNVEKDEQATTYSDIEDEDD